jgi:hypothetical protein
MRTFVITSLFAASLSLSLLGCAGRTPFPTVNELELDTVVLYRNGIGYFERRGKVSQDILRLRVRKDQVNDLLKSLTVVDRDGQAVSVSMPLDPAAWSNAAMATLAPGRGSLAQVLDSMRGSEITLWTHDSRSLRGRVMMVERSVNEPDPSVRSSGAATPGASVDSLDWKLTVMSGGRMQVVRLSKVKAVRLHDGDFAMQLNRSLDAAAGEGMFEQVEIEVRLTGARTHELTISYVVASPMWKPTYRVVLPKDGSGDALLQAWAVIDNVSGEDWSAVNLSLTSGAPIAFRYDLHTPRTVQRSDMTESGVHKRAAVALGETSWGRDDPMAVELDDQLDWEQGLSGAGGDGWDGSGGLGAAESNKDKRAPSSRASAGAAPPSPPSAAPKPSPGPGSGAAPRQAAGPSLDLESLRRSTDASARSQRISGLTRVDLTTPVTVPDGTSTMVAIINESIAAEQTFLYKPGGAGYGYEANPYRVLRFQNSTDYVLEPGPIAIYSGGSFVGEGLSEVVGAGTSVTIPFAVEPGVLVTSAKQFSGQEMTLTRVVRGVLEVESFYQTTTTWDVRGPASPTGFKVLIRQPQTAPNYELATRPKGTEDLEGAWLIPVEVAAKQTRASLEVVEQTPSKTTIAIWDQQALPLLEKFLAAAKLDAAARAKLQPIVDLRREIGRIDTEVDGLRRQQAELEQRAEQARRNLEALKKDPAAGALRSQLNSRLDEFSSEADARGRKIVALELRRLEHKIALEDLIQDLDLRAPVASKP